LEIQIIALKCKMSSDKYRKVLLKLWLSVIKLSKISENFSLDLRFLIVSSLWREMVRSPYFQKLSNTNIKKCEYVID